MGLPRLPRACAPAPAASSLCTDLKRHSCKPRNLQRVWHPGKKKGRAGPGAGLREGCSGPLCARKDRAMGAWSTSCGPPEGPRGWRALVCSWTAGLGGVGGVGHQIRGAQERGPQPGGKGRPLGLQRGHGGRRGAIGPGVQPPRPTGTPMSTGKGLLGRASESLLG